MGTSRFRAWRWGLLVLAGLAAGGGTTVRAETLRWRFKPGETLHWTLEQKRVVREVAAQREFKTTSTQTSEVTWTVKSVGDDGTAELTSAVDRMRTKVETPYGKVEFDSKSPEKPANPIAEATAEVLKNLIGAEFTFKMSPSGELRDVRVPEQLSKALRDMAKGAPAGSNNFSEEGLKAMISDMGVQFPREDLDEGKTWSQQSKIATPFGALVVDKVFRFEGRDEQAGAGVYRIGLQNKVAVQPDAKSEVRFAIKSQSGGGTILFDNSAGRVTRSNASEKLESVVTVKGKDDQGLEVQRIEETTSSMTLAR